MTAEIINLRQVRKQREREARAAEAAENRVRFGRTRGERERDEVSEAQKKLLVDNHRLEPAAEPAPDDGPNDPAPKSPSPKSP